MKARTLMVQGTASAAGKSLLTTALCRYFTKQGIAVAPFKAWNMALNSFVTSEGGEIGRAQAIQAKACGIDPTVDMNPVLVKCEPNHRLQLVVLGKVVGSLTGEEYRAYAPGLKTVIAQALNRLSQNYELILLEGAGSPAEINLGERDLANMYAAGLYDSPVLLVADIDRGGVFASLLGTLEWLSPEDRLRVKALVINKFRGSPEHLKPGIDLLEQRTSLPVLGILPYLQDLSIGEEDSAVLEDRISKGIQAKPLNLGVIQYPHLSNFDDFQPLEKSNEVGVHYLKRPQEAEGMDLLILPGTKATGADLGWLREKGFERILQNRVKEHQPILGICGGYQMLGESLEDPHGIELSQSRISGLGLLSVTTVFEKTKTTSQVEAEVKEDSFLTQGQVGKKIKAYEIHMGRVHRGGRGTSLFQISRNQSSVQEEEGAVGPGGFVLGTLLHGLFENEILREALITSLGKKKGLQVSAGTYSLEGEFDRLAEMVGQNMDGEFLRRLVGIK